jgi:hypothetical protein
MLVFYNNNEEIVYAGDDDNYLNKDSIIPFATDWNWLMEAIQFLEENNIRVSISSNIIDTFLIVSELATQYNQNN